MLADITQFLDVGDIRQFFDLREAGQLDRTKARSTPAFDLTFAIVTALAVVGLWLDIWSHVTYGADQSIFSEYHLLFYTATVMAGLFLGYTGVTNLLAGYRWSDALPVGYSLSLAGIIFFGIVGVIDLTSHAIWGFETGIEALTSPTHLLLFSGIFVFVSGPIRAEVARQRRGETLTFARLVPFVLSVVATLSAITFPVFSSLPLVSKPTALQIGRVDQGATLGVLGVFLETAITMGLFALDHQARLSSAGKYHADLRPVLRAHGVGDPRAHLSPDLADRGRPERRRDGRLEAVRGRHVAVACLWRGGPGPDVERLLRVLHSHRNWRRDLVHRVYLDRHDRGSWDHRLPLGVSHDVQQREGPHGRTSPA